MEITIEDIEDRIYSININKHIYKKSYLFLKYILNKYYNDKFNYKLNISDITKYLYNVINNKRINIRELYRITKILIRKYPNIFDNNSLTESFIIELLDKTINIKNNFIIDILDSSENLSDESKTKINHIIYEFLSSKYFDDNLLNNVVLLINKYYDIIDANIFLNSFNDNDLAYVAYDIFNILLTKDNGPNIVFQILDKNPIYSFKLADITMTDKDYHPYILKYLNNLIIYLENTNIVYNDPNLDKQAHFLIAQILINDPNVPKNEIIRHYLKSDNNGRRIGAKLIQEHYLKSPMSSSLDFLEDNDTDTLVNILNYLL